MNSYLNRGLYLDEEKKGYSKSDVIYDQEGEESLESQPPYNVVLLDDNDHTYDYVIEMLVKICGHSKMRAFAMACEVDYSGRVVVYTSSKEEATVKRDQIHAFGPDWRLERSKGPMTAIVEPCS